MHHQWNNSGPSIEKINLQANAPGMYFYRIMNAGVVKQGMVVKQ
jgi:hypothetical protein